MKYGKEVEYKNGFGFINNDKGEENKYRTDVYSILYKQNYILIYENFKIAANSEIKIYLKDKIKSIEHFFDSEYDPNVESITQIDLSYFFSDNLVQTNSLFKGCSILKSINLTFQNKVSLINMESMFSGCNSIQLLNLSEIKTSSVTNMSHLFEGCYSVKNIYLNNWDTSNVVDMNSMFEGCIALEEINISHFKTSALTDMSKMFYDCQKLKTINLSSFDTKSMKYMDQLFYNCSALEILDIKNFNLKNLESFEGIFTKMNKIQYIDLMNLINEKNIWESLDKNETFYICQTRAIIENPFAFNCCEFLTNPDECNYIPTTQLMNIYTTEIPINPPIKSTIISTTFPTPIEKKELTYLALAILTNYTQDNSNKSSTFNIHVSRRSGNSNPKNAKMGYKVTYNRVLRGLEEEKEGNCTLQGNGMGSNIKYLCKMELDNSNIKNIQITNFIFDPKDNINLIITPLAKMIMNNVQDANKYNYLSDAEIYFLEHCSMNRYQKRLLNISGEIQDSKFTIKTKDIILMIYHDSENDSMGEIDCTFTDKKLKNYTLNCRVNEGMINIFQAAISFFDDNILILYFDSYNESIIDNTGMEGGIRYNLNKNRGLSAGAIIGIVLASIFCIGALIAAFKIFGKNNIKKDYPEISTIHSLKIKN